MNYNIDASLTNGVQLKTLSVNGTQNTQKVVENAVKRKATSRLSQALSTLMRFRLKTHTFRCV